MIEQAEACTVLKCGMVVLHEALQKGILPGMKMGKEWVIPRQAFFAAVNKLAVEEAQERRRAALTNSPQQPPLMPQKRGPGRPRVFHPFPDEPHR